MPGTFSQRSAAPLASFWDSHFSMRSCLFSDWLQRDSELIAERHISNPYTEFLCYNCGGWMITLVSKHIVVYFFVSLTAFSSKSGFITIELATTPNIFCAKSSNLTTLWKCSFQDIAKNFPRQLTLGIQTHPLCRILNTPPHFRSKHLIELSKPNSKDHHYVFCSLGLLV